MRGVRGENAEVERNLLASVHAEEAWRSEDAEELTARQREKEKRPADRAVCTYKGDRARPARAKPSLSNLRCFAAVSAVRVLAELRFDPRLLSVAWCSALLAS